MRKIVRLAAAVLLLSNIGLSQIGLKVPLTLTQIPGISSSWAGECGPNAIDNTSPVSRQNTYSAISVASASGTWTVGINFSDVSCTGPSTSFGGTSQITQASNPAIAYGLGYHAYIQIAITGNPFVTYVGQNQLPISTSTGSISFPCTISQGCTGQVTATAALQALLAGSNQGTITNKVQMAGTNNNTAGAPLCDASDGSATTSGCAERQCLPSSPARIISRPRLREER